MKVVIYPYWRYNPRDLSGEYGLEEFTSAKDRKVSYEAKQLLRQIENGMDEDEAWQVFEDFLYEYPFTVPLKRISKDVLRVLNKKRFQPTGDFLYSPKYQRAIIYQTDAINKRGARSLQDQALEALRPYTFEFNGLPIEVI